MAAMGSTGIINSAMTDPNAPASSTAASASSVGAAPAATPAPTGSTITTAPNALQSGTSNPTSAEAGYLNQLNSAATPSASSATTPPASTSGSNVSTPASASSGIVASAMNRSASNPSASSSTASTTAPAAPSTSTAATTAPAAPTAAQTSATQAQIAQIYQSTFGRPPDAAGLAFWTQAAQSNPGMDLQSNIAAGAQTQDKAAEQSLNGTGNAGNWTSPSLNANLVQPGVDTWNANTNSWQSPSITSTGSAATYNPNLLGTPTQLNVAPNQTVQGQLANIDNPNSAIIMAARNGANQQANASGLLNSSMAVTAGDTAAYNAAIPIAEQDAGIYNNAASTNAAAANTFAVNNQNAINTAGQFNAGATNTLTGQNIAANTSLANAGTAAQTSTANQAAQDTTSQAIAQLNATNSAAIANSNNASQASTNYANAIATIATSNIGDPPGTKPGTGKATADANATAAYTTVMTQLGYSAAQIQAQLSNGGVAPGSGANPNTSSNLANSAVPNVSKILRGA